MPLFDFQCQDCGHRFEELVTARTRSRPCPRCGERAKRLPPAVVAQGARFSVPSLGSGPATGCDHCH